MDPLNRGAEQAVTERRRRGAAHPWADAYLRAHGIASSELRAEILEAILARVAMEGRRGDGEGDGVMEEAQRFIDEQLASLVGGLAPGHEATAGRFVFWLADGPEQCPAALLDPRSAPAALRFRMRTVQLPKLPALERLSMASGRTRAAEWALRLSANAPARWLRVTLCALSACLLTCHG